MNWNELNEILELYKKLDAVDEVAPVAHTRMRGHVGVLLDFRGNFLGAIAIQNETCYVPCTEESETRTNNVAPHLIHDNMSYVCRIPGYEKRHRAYIEQLYEYIIHVDDALAKAVYRLMQRRMLKEKIEPIVRKLKYSEPEKVNVCFCLYGETKNTIDRQWEEYYVSTLPINGICGITGEECHIPKSYPRGIRRDTDFGRLFVRKNEDSLSSMPEIVPGYVTAQKIIHTLQEIRY